MRCNQPIAMGKKTMGPHRPIALMENAPRFIIRKPVFQRVFGLITPVMRVFSVVTSKEKPRCGEHAKKMDVQGKKRRKRKTLVLTIETLG